MTVRNADKSRNLEGLYVTAALAPFYCEKHVMMMSPPLRSSESVVHPGVS